MRHLFFVSILLSPFILHSQIWWGMNNQGLSFIAKFDTTHFLDGSDGYFFDSVSISIHNQATGKLIQNIPDRELPAIYDYMGKEFCIQLSDLNFDGYDDLGIVTGYYINGGQTDFDYFLWNPEKKKFIKDDTISGAMGLYVDRDKKILHSHWRSGFSVFGHGVYRWEGEKFREVAFEESVEAGPERFETTRKIWRNGKYELTISPVEDWLNIPHDECDLWKETE